MAQRRQVLSQHESMPSQGGLRRSDVRDEADEFRGPWFRQAVAARYVGRPNVRAFYCWRDRHGIVSHKGLIHKADLDRVLGLRKVR